MAEAHWKAGDREQALEYYRMALEVDPGFDNARRMLEQLTQRSH